jgi:hypothetical protein
LGQIPRLARFQADLCSLRVQQVAVIESERVHHFVFHFSPGFRAPPPLPFHRSLLFSLPLPLVLRSALEGNCILLLILARCSSRSKKSESKMGWKHAATSLKSVVLNLEPSAKPDGYWTVRRGRRLVKSLRSAYQSRTVRHSLGDLGSPFTHFFTNHFSLSGTAPGPFSFLQQLNSRRDR